MAFHAESKNGLVTEHFGMGWGKKARRQRRSVTEDVAQCDDIVISSLLIGVPGRKCVCVNGPREKKLRLFPLLCLEIKE